MKPIIMKELKQRHLALMAYTVAALGFIWLYISLFPYLQSQAQGYAKMLDSLPRPLMDAFGFEDTFFSNVQAYMASEMFSLIWPLLSIFMLTSTAATNISGEIEKATIGTLLAQPISRAKLFFAKYLSGITALIIFTFVTIVSCLPISAAYGVDFMASRFLLFTVAALLFGLAVYSFAFMVSAMRSEKSQVYFTTGGLLFFMYVCNIIGGLKPGLSGLKYASVFHYFSPPDALVRGSISGLSIAILLGSSILFTVIGLAIFKKRDISI